MADRTFTLKVVGDIADAKKSLGNLEKEVGSVKKSVGGISSVAKGLSGGLLAFAGGQALGAVVDTVAGFVREAEEAAKTARATEAVIKSTGGAANVTAQQVDDLATSLSLKAGIDDEVIASGENVLLTFTKIANQTGKGNDIFDQATATALDMSVALGTDLQGSVVQVGKALNDPIKGITALSRVGVSFTQQQKDQIAALVESGDVLGAQKIILGELNTEFGGAAEAGATASGKLGVVWGNIQEQLGKVLLPLLEKLANWLTDVLPGAVAWTEDAIASIRAFFEEHRAQFEAIGKVLKALFDWVVFQIKIFVTAARIEFEVISAIVEFFYNYVYQPLVGFITALVDGFVRFGKGAHAAFKVVADAASTAARIIGGVVGGIADFFARIPDRINGLLSNVTAIITYPFRVASNGIAGVVNGIADFFYRLPGRINNFFGHVADIITYPFEVAFGWIRDAWNNTVGGFGFEVPGWVPGIGGRGFHIPYMADGGIVTGPMIAMLGEAGPEAVIPLDQLGGMGGGNVIYLTVQSLNPTAETGRVIAESLAQYDRGAGTSIVGYNGRLGG